MNQEDRIPHRISTARMLDGKEVTVRSATEARWGEFFSDCGFEWQYEPERFALSGGTIYTPDFLVTNLGWVECKPTTYHIQESWPRIKKFLSESCEKQTGYKSRLYLFVNSEPPLTLNNNVLFREGKIYVPTSNQMGTLLLDALGLDETHWCRVNVALRNSEKKRENRMLPISDIIRFEMDRLIRPLD